MKMLDLFWQRLTLTTVIIFWISTEISMVNIEDARIRGVLSVLNGTVEVKCGQLWYTACLWSYLAKSEKKYICNQQYQNLYTYATDGYHTNWSSIVADGSANKVPYIKDQATCKIKRSCTKPISMECEGLEASKPEISIDAATGQLSYPEKSIISILCKVSGGIPAPRVRIITRDGANVTSETPQWSSRGTSATNPDYPEIVFYSQVMVNLTHEDNGAVYKCKVDQDNFESQTDSITLNVQYAPIIEVPVNKTANEGGYVAIECVVKSNPSAVVGWYDSDGVQKSNSAHLYLQNVAVSDMKNYSCIATNNVGGSALTSSKTAELYVNYIRLPDEVFVREFEDVRINCTLVFYTDVLQTTWTRQVANKNILSYSTTLYLNNVSRSDAGKYKCKVTNIIENGRQAMATLTNLHVTYPPAVSVPTNITVNNLDDIILKCSVESYPESLVTWYSPDGVELSNTTTLELKNVDRTYIGNYTCSARNVIAGLTYTDNKKTSVFVNFEPIVNVSQNTSGVEFHDIVIGCQVMSYPLSTVTWQNENKEEISNSSSLILKHVRLPDAGEYTCIAKNVFRGTFHTDSAATTLYITRNPKCFVPIVPRVKQRCRCNRQCKFQKNIKNMTMEEVKEAIEQTKKELTVEPNTLTSFIRKKISMKDTRASSIGFGIIAIIILILVLGFLSAGDIIGLVKFFENRRKPSHGKRSVKREKRRRFGLRKELKGNRGNGDETRNAQVNS